MFARGYVLLCTKQTITNHLSTEVTDESIFQQLEISNSSRFSDFPAGFCGLHGIHLNRKMFRSLLEQSMATHFSTLNGLSLETLGIQKLKIHLLATSQPPILGPSQRVTKCPTDCRSPDFGLPLQHLQTHWMSPKISPRTPTTFLVFQNA